MNGAPDENRTHSCRFASLMLFYNRIVYYHARIYLILLLHPVYRLMAEWNDTESNVKLGGFQSQLEASYVYCNTEEL